MNKLQRIDFFRTIQGSLGRFLSLFFIVLLGTAFYAGIRSCQPDMTASADRYYDETRFMDLCIMSPLGLTGEDLDAIRSTSGIACAEGAYSDELLCTSGENELVLRVVSAGTDLNHLTLTEGRLPESPDECFLDAGFLLNDGYSLGDQITLLDSDGTEPESLKQNTYKIVGFGTWSWYLSWSRGSASVGDGTTDAFLVLPPESFNMSCYTAVYSRVSGAELENSFSDAYQDYISPVSDALNKLSETRSPLRYESLISDGQSNLTDARNRLAEIRAELDKGEQQILDGEASYQEAAAKLEEGEAAFSDAETRLQDARTALDAAASYLPADTYAQQSASLSAQESVLAEQRNSLSETKRSLIEHGRELDAAKRDFAGQKQKALSAIAELETAISEGENTLNNLEPSDWYVLDRNSIQSYTEYNMDSQRIGNIGKVFPAIFFLVAALISLSSMTRMVEEERLAIGTMKALGYPNFSISLKYSCYAAFATLTGGLIGVLIGSKLLPFVILSAYGILYSNLPFRVLSYYPALCILSIALASFSTVGAAFLTCLRDLRAMPAVLMRPVAPASGKRILLERIPFVWNFLNFNYKSAFRNLLRYKKRFWMTVLGIGGCMSLLLVGFGLRDSIASIVDIQYDNLWLYDFVCGIDDTGSNPSSLYNTIQASESTVADGLFARQISADAKGNTAGGQSVYLLIPEDPDHARDFFLLRSRRNGELYTLSNDGVVITEKLSRLLSLEAGDAIQIKIDGSYLSVPVSAISENYLYHYVYMTPALYARLYGENPVYNELYLKTDSDDSEESLSSLASYLLTLDSISSVSRIESLKHTAADMMNTLNLVVWVLIISAGLLAFVVIFNLNHIAISERHRELATLKVLGMFDIEVALYLYRENVFLTIFGILIGVSMGTALHRYVIRTVEIDMIMFGQEISLAGYLSAALITLIFAALVNLVMLRRLRAIDMVESTKSIE